MNNSEYWTKFLQRRLSRRRVLQGGAAIGASLWVGSTLGCGGGGEESTATATTKSGTTTGAATAAATPQPKYGGTYRTYATADTRSFDPHIETADGRPITLGYNGVVKFNSDGSKVIPDLAMSWEQPDDITYIFKLNQGVKFHNIPPVNGREFTAEDVKFSIERQMTNPPGKFTHGSFFIGKLAKIDVVDNYTVKFTSNFPDATFLNYLGSPWTKMIAREAVDQYGELNNVIIGTGPFMLQKQEKNVETVMVKNPNYFKKGLPYVDTVSIRIIPDASTEAAAFLAGELDALTPATTDEERVKKAKPNYPTRESWYIVPMILRVRPYDDKRPPKPPFSDKQVRKAIQLALDKQEYINAVYGGRGAPMVGQIPPERKPWALPDSDQIKQDIPKAKQLLAQAGYPNGFKAELYTMNQWQYSDSAEVAKGQLAKIGIDVDIKLLESAQYYNKVYTYDYDMNVHVMLGSEEPEEYIRPYFGTAATFYRWGNPEIQKKADEQSRIMDVQKRVQAILEVQRMILDDAPVNALFVGKYITIVHPRVQNLISSWNTFDWSYYENMWLSE